MPSVEGKFPTFHEFASASLSEIYGERLDQAYHVVANHLESGVWMNRSGDGGKPKFKWIAFPRIAQIAPSYGLVVHDFNSDGHPDLHLVQNSYSTQPETGLWRGGLSQLLLGKGDGTFLNVPPRKSGLIISDDGKSSALVDLDRDQRPDLIATQNNGPSVSFKSNGDKLLEILLRGKKGNPNGIGAIVKLQHRDGTSKIHEIKAGSGYLSQSPPTIFTNPKSIQSITVQWPDGLTKSYPSPVGNRQKILAR